MRRLSVDRPGTPGCAGFTLLELMVAMLLLTIIVTSSVSLLFLNIRGWDALNADSDRTLDATLINQRIRRIVQGLSPIIRHTEKGRRLAFDGQLTQLHFISAAPQQYRSGGLFEYLLREELASENSRDLVLYYIPYRPDATDFVLPEAGEKRTLIADTGGVSFLYYGRTKRLDRPAWHENWADDMESYPQIVKMKLSSDRLGALESARFIRLQTATSEQLRISP